MSEKVHVDPGVLADAAGHHREASAYLSTASSCHEDIRAALDSLGPIYGDFRRAAESMLDARQACYDGQSAEHALMSENLKLAAATWTQHEQGAAEAFRNLTDGR